MILKGIYLLRHPTYFNSYTADFKDFNDAEKLLHELWEIKNYAALRKL